MEKYSIGGSSQSVNCGTKEVTIWLCFVTATGGALGDGVMYVRTPVGAVVEAIISGGGPARGGAGSLFATLIASYWY